MGLIWNVFRVLPFWIKLILLFAVGILLFKVLKTTGPYLMQLAVLAWLVAGIGLMRAAGQLQIADRVPFVAAALDMFVPRAALATATDRAPSMARSIETAPAESAPPAATADRETVRAEAERALGAMAGVGDAYAQLGALANQAILAQQRGLSGFGSAASAIVVVMHGPSGTGKSTFARHAVDLLYGIGALAGREIVELGRDAVSVYGVDTQGLRAKLESALGGTLLLEDADWLAAEGETGGPPPGANVTGPIVDFAQRHPGKLLVLCTASEKPGRQLASDPAQRLWRAKVDLRSVSFANLDDEALWSIMQRLIAEKRLQIESAAAKSAEKLLAAWRRSDGADFRNAHAVRDLVDKAFAALSRRVSESGGAAGHEATTITNADISAAARELGLPT